MIDKESRPWNDQWMIVSDHKKLHKGEGTSKVKFRGTYFEAKEFIENKRNKTRGRICKNVRGEFAVCMMENKKIIEHFKQYEPADHVKALNERRRQNERYESSKSF